MIIARRRHLFKPGEEHTKYANLNGEYVPSVTTILKIINKSSLVYWANSLGWKRKSVKDELEKSALIGTLAHSYIEKIMLYEEVDFTPVELHGVEIYNQVINAVTSFIKWWKVNRKRVKLIHVEYQMTSDLYGGTSDLICELDGKLCILDFKTSKDFYYTMFLQMAGYAKMYEDVNPHKTVEDMAILRLDKKDGEIAELLSMTDVVEMSGENWTNREGIEVYMDIFDKVVSLFYDLHDLSYDWNTKL